MFTEILFKILLFKGGVLIYAEHCIYIYIDIYMYYQACQYTMFLLIRFLEKNQVPSYFFLFRKLFHLHIRD